MNGQHDAVSIYTSILNLKFVCCLSISAINFTVTVIKPSISLCPKSIFCVESAHLPHFLHMQILNHLVSLVLHQRFKAVRAGRLFFVVGFFVSF